MNNFSCSGIIGEYGFKYEPQKGNTPAYHKFTVGVVTDKKKADGKYEYINIKCTVWGARAELIRTNFHIKDPIEVSGTLSMNEWTDNNGNKHTDLQISSANISFVPKGFNNGQQQSAPPAPNFTSNIPTPSFTSNANTPADNHGINGGITPNNFVNTNYTLGSDILPESF